MAISAAVIAKIAASASSKENRGKIFKLGISFVCGALVVVILILTAFAFLISGVFGLLTGLAVNENWNLVRNNIAGVFEGLDRSAAKEVKEIVYDFMPDFSVNLSKAAISVKYDKNALLMYDTADYQAAEAMMKSAAEAIRDCDSKADFNEMCNKYLISGFDFDAIKADEIFNSNNDLDQAADYSDETLSLLSAIAANSLGKYFYEYEEYTATNGKNAKKQVLTVTENGKTQIVEYHAIGGVELYLPEFIAYYQVRLLDDSLIHGTDGEQMDQAIEEGLGGNVAEAENQEELNDAISNDTPSSLLNLMQIADLSGILGRAVRDGAVGAKTEIITDGNTEKLLIVLEAPDMKEWLELFNIDDSLSDYIDEYKKTIETILTDNGIDEAEFYLNLNDFFQNALFVYFEGFFNLPVDSSDLSENSNGIITKFGDYSDFHTMGFNYAKTIETGVTLKLSDTNTEAKIDLLPSVNRDCIEDIVIYDIWLGGEHDNGEYSSDDIKSVTYDCDVITIAYTIDTERFEKDYGFPFPSPFGETEEMNGSITMLVEYSCLCESYYPTISYQAGDSIKDIINEGNFALGYCHDGINKETEQNAASSSNWFRHHGNAPHLSIKVAFLNYPSYSGMTIFQTDTNVYSGITGSNNRTDMYLVNPLLWFKGFRTEIDDKALVGLVGAH